MPRTHQVKYLEKGQVRTVNAITPEPGDEWPVKRQRKPKSPVGAKPAPEKPTGADPKK